MKKETYFLIIILGFISCKDEKQIIKKDKISNYEISIILPDTVFVNELYDGKINFKNDLDTITTSLNDVKKARFIEYAFLKTNNINYNDEHLKKIATDTFVTINNRMIPLFAIRFEKLGLNYIDGIITDEVVIEDGAKGKNGEPMDRIITNEFRATKGIYVIEKPATRIDKKKE